MPHSQDRVVGYPTPSASKDTHVLPVHFNRAGIQKRLFWVLLAQRFLCSHGGNVEPLSTGSVALRVARLKVGIPMTGVGYCCDRPDNVDLERIVEGL